MKSIVKSKNYLIKKFKLKKSRFIISPSLRFGALFENFKEKKFRKIKNILIALPISYQDSKDIINIFKKFVNRYETKKFKFFMNYHPMLNFEKLMKNNVELNEKFFLFNESFSKKHNNFDCIISNTSSICFEAIALSTPVIIVQNSKGITQNPISLVKKDIWRLVKNENDLKQAFVDLLDKKDRKYYYKNSKIIRNQYFSKINQKKITKFFGLN